MNNLNFAPTGHPVSRHELNGLGVKEGSLRKVETTKDLEKNPPAIVIAEAFRNASFVQNQSRIQHLRKGGKYVMGLGTFQQLHVDQNRRIKLLKPSRTKFSNIYRKYEGEDLTDKKILIWRTGGIGDLLFIQPNLRYIKEKYPTCQIYFACGPQYQSMVEDWPWIDKLLDLPFQFSYLQECDYHVIFEGVIERTKESEKVNAYRLFTDWMKINLSDEDLYPIQNVKEDKIEETKKVLDEWGLKEKDFVVAQLKASSPIRTPSPEMWKKVLTALVEEGHNVVITDAPHNNQWVTGIISQLDDEIKKKVFNYSKHSKTLDYSIALISLSKLTVSTDSAVSHIAAGLDVPCFGIFGPFLGELRLDTYKKSDWINCNLQCAPCFTHGQEPCRNSKDGFSKCYEKLDIDIFKEKIGKLLNG